MQGRGYLIRGDARRIPLGDQSVHMAATSPPYLGLRDYGLKPSRWPAMSYRPMVGLPPVEVPALECCLGLEPTPEAFVGHLVLVFREVYRVLRDDGTLWLNLGDSYGSGSRKKRAPDRELAARAMDSRPQGFGKQLMGMPWRVAFALQADGWVLRSDVIWAKRSPMPESVTDRPTRAHEYVFLLSKRADYFYDGEAIREPFTDERMGGSGTKSLRYSELSGRNGDSGLGPPLPYAGRNRRSVWMVSSEACPDAHFATFPRKLVRPMILAGTSEKGCCPGCGAPWRRIVRKDRKPTRPGKDSKINRASRHIESPYNGQGGSIVGNRDPMRHVTEAETVGWGPSCGCGAPQGFEPGDLDLVRTPTGEIGVAYDARERGCPRPYRPTGGSGNERPRSDREGVRLMTRYERRRYAEQLRSLPESIQDELRVECGAEAFSHYRKPGDASGRPIPPDLLECWVAAGHLCRVELPEWTPPDPVPCLVLDCFNGSGKTGEQALLLGRSYVGMDLSWEYLSTIAVDRLERGLRPHKPRGRPVADPEGQNSLFDMEGV